MKKLYFSILLLIITLIVNSQAPQSFNYQAIVRDASGNEKSNQAVGMQISILQGSAGGTAVYVERFTSATNSYGLINIQVGTGNVQSGTFSTIDWANGPYFLKTEIDDTGGTTYIEMGTSQLISVPYALHAETADSIKGVSPDDFITGDEYEEYDLENLINNASFELFSSGDNTYPDYWSLLGEEDPNTSADKIEFGYFGSSAIKLTDASAAQSIALQQEIYSEGNLPSHLLDETITLSLWAKKGTSSGLQTGEIEINDGSASTVLSLDDSETWHKKIIIHIIASDASKLTVELRPTSNNTAEAASYIFDGVMLTIGPYTPSFSLNTLDQVSGAGYATIDMQNENITNLADPVNEQDAATKKYVDEANYEYFYLGQDTLGGVVFYVYKGSDGQQHGLIVSKTETYAKWQNTGVTTNATRSWDGVYNMGLMSDSPAKDWVTSNFSTDWYLPSIDELGVLFHNRFHVNKALDNAGETLLGNNAAWWSSTESSEGSFAFYFYNYIRQGNKEETVGVRAVKAF